MSQARKAWPLVLCLLMAGLVRAGTTGSESAGLLLVLDKSDAEAVLVDAATYEVIVRLPTGEGPHEVAASADGRFAYVTNYGMSHGGSPGNTLTVLDLTGRKVKDTWTIGSFRSPHGICVSRNGRYVWVTSEAAKAVLELNSETGKLLHTWKTNQDGTHMLVPSLDEKKLYAASISSGTVSIIDRTRPMDGTAAPWVATGKGSEGIALSPDGREVWVVNRQANSISVIDTSTDKVVATFPSGGTLPIRVKFTPDGKQVWVSQAQSNAVSVIDAATRATIATLEVGTAPVGMVMAPDGKRVFIAATSANQVVVVDTATRQILRRIKTGNEPDGMAWVPGR